MESCREAISECHGATVTFNLIVYPSTLKHLTVTLCSNAHTCSDIDVFRFSENEVNQITHQQCISFNALTIQATDR